MKKQTKKLLRKLKYLANFLPFVNRFTFGGNKVELNGALLRRCRIQCSGKDNQITFCGGNFSDCTIKIFGNHNRITVGQNVLMRNAELWIEDDGGSIIIGDDTKLTGKIQLAAIEGTSIAIGSGCLFSSDISFMSGDAHSVLDMDGGRINPSKDIAIGDHVWVGQKVTVLKGAYVADDNIIGACALVTGCFRQNNTVIGGNPAKVIKQGVDWTHERI